MMIIFKFKYIFNVTAYCILSMLCVWALTQVKAAYSEAQETANSNLSNKLRLCVDPDWVPFESINEKGMHEGIAADLINMVSERSGVKFTLVPTKSWEESVRYSKEGKCEALSFLNETDNRREWLSFSEPVFTDVNVFITREEHPFISAPGRLDNETLVLPKGTSIEELIRRDYPNIKIVTVDTEAEAFKMVSDKKADMTLRSLIVAAYTIKKEGWFNLKISGQLPEYVNKLSIGVIKDREGILEQINNGVKSISEHERGMVVNKHVSINVQTVIDYSLLFKVTGILSVIIIIVLAWIWQVKKHNRDLELISQTDQLTGIANRNKLNAVMKYEYGRSMRSSHPLSVILVDIDHFKKVNDDLGHLLGDIVLKEMALLLKSCIREVDVAGRWGGEEFLIICPDTDSDSSMQLANRLVTIVSEYEFSSKRTQTISAGVTTLSDDDTFDDLLLRADAALYKAKNSGRNRAVQLVI